jgi:hypothetical protein
MALIIQKGPPRALQRPYVDHRRRGRLRTSEIKGITWQSPVWSLSR